MKSAQLKQRALAHTHAHTSSQQVKPDVMTIVSLQAGLLMTCLSLIGLLRGEIHCWTIIKCNLLHSSERLLKNLLDLVIIIKNKYFNLKHLEDTND